MGASRPPHSIADTPRASKHAENDESEYKSQINVVAESAGDYRRSHATPSTESHGHG